MAYALKYQINYKNILDVSCRIDIELDGYAGDVISVKGHGGNACTISHVNDNLDKYDPIIESKAEINLIQQGQIDIAELQTSADFDFRVRYFESGNLEWEGFIIPDGIQDSYQATPYILSITATDGLNWLKGKEFRYSFGGQRNYLLYLRQIFHWQGLSGGLQTEMPIRWVCTLENLEYPGDMLSNPDLQIDYKGIIDQDANKEKETSGKKKSMYWVLENIAKSMGARIYQAGGRWNVERVNDVVTGSYSYMECDSAGTITGPTPIDVNKTVSGVGRGGDYEFIREDAIVTVKPGVKKVIVTYKPQIFDTILPNGDFELVVSNTVLYWRKLDSRDLIDPGNLIYWWNQLGVTTQAIAPSPGIYGESKYSVGFPIEPDATGSNYALLYDSDTSRGIAVPIDTSIWDTFTLQFKYTVNELNAAWIDPAVNIRMWYIESDNDAHTVVELSELQVYGYWKRNVTNDSPIPINRVNGQQDVGDVVQVVFNNNGDISMPYNAVRGVQRGLLNGLTFILLPSSTIHTTVIDDIKLAPTSKKSEVWEVEQTGSTFTMEQEIENEIGSAYTGFYWSNYTKSWGNTFRDFQFKDTIGLSKNLIDKAAMQSGNYSPVNGGEQPSDNWIRTPHIPVQENTEYTLSGHGPASTTAARLCFYDASDTFISSVNAMGPGDTDPVTFTTPPNTAYVGINVANAVGIGLNPSDNEYANSVQLELGPNATTYEPYTTPTIFEGELSKILSYAVLRNNALPSRVMQCSIKGPVKYGDIISFDGLTGKYMILQMDKNTEDESSQVIAIEVRNDAVSMEPVKHYGK